MPPQAEPTLAPQLKELLLDSAVSSTPDGKPPDFNTSENLRAAQIVILSLCLPLMTLATMMRVYTQRFVIGRLRPEDYSLMISWVFMVAAAAYMFHTTASTCCAHTWNMTIRSAITLLKDIFYVELFYNIMVLFLKTCIILQYLRIFAPHGRADPLMFYGNWAVLISCVIAYTTLMFVRIFDCSSSGDIQDQLLPGICVEQNIVLLAHSIWNFVSDMIILVLPLRRIWTLHMSRKYKISLSGLFGVGSLACVATAVRVYYSVKLVETDDFTWDAHIVALTGIIEATLGFLGASLPVFPRFIQYLRNRFNPLSSTYQNKPYASYVSSRPPHSVNPHHPSPEPQSYAGVAREEMEKSGNENIDEEMVSPTFERSDEEMNTSEQKGQDGELSNSDNGKEAVVVEPREMESAESPSRSRRISHIAQLHRSWRD